MGRIFALFVMFALMFIVNAPIGVAAQTDDDPLGWGEGVAADAATTAAVQAFFEDFTAAVNLRDGSAASMLSLDLLTEFYGSYEEGVSYFSGQFVASTNLFGVETVVAYPDGGFSAEVLFQGISFPGAYNTYRYFLIETPFGYAIHHLQVLEPRLAEGITGVSVAMALSDDGLTISETEIPEVDVLFLSVQNTNIQEPLSTGVHVLPDGMTASEAQAQLLDDLASLEWLGGTPTGPDAERTYAFVVEPGITYFIQQFADGGDSRFLVLLSGEEHFGTITVLPEEPAQ